MDGFTIWLISVCASLLVFSVGEYVGHLARKKEVRLYMDLYHKVQKENMELLTLLHERIENE